MRPQSYTLADGMSFLHLSEPQFRTDRLTAVLALPLRQHTAAGYALLPGLLTRSCENYPTVAAFNRRLDELYGAAVQSQLFQLGEWQMLLFSVSYLNRRYIPGGEDIANACTHLLLDVLFHPVLEDGAFPQDAFDEQQRCLLERLEGEINNKRMYARQKCKELLCPDHPFSINPCGTPETVKALTPVTAAAAREQMLTEAQIHWIYQGADDPQPLMEMLQRQFAALPYRRPVQLTSNPAFTMKETELTESMPINQAKLVLGFRIAITEPDGPVMAARLMNALWGGCATSLLFRHVREEQSLCYYCASSYDRFQGVLLVDSGIQAENAQRTTEEVLKQLDAIRQGNFTDEELETARRSLIQQFVSMSDTPDELEVFYTGQTIYGNYLTPEETANQLLAVTREDVCRAARMTHFDSSYLLKPNGEVTGQ